MQFSALFIATMALVSGAPLGGTQLTASQQNTLDAMTGYQGAMTNAAQVQDTLNRQLQSNSGAHSNQARVNAFITGADSQIDNSIATVSAALAPLTGGLSEAIGSVLLGPFVQSVTNGAEVLLANLIGGGEDMVDAQMTAALTGNYAKLTALASKNNINTAKLENLSQQITQTVSGKSKRDDSSSDVKGGLDGVKGSITNMQQVIDTMKNDMGTGHAAQDTINAFITGADSQIDNAIATLSYGLDSKLTGGISGDIGNFLLGPFVQSVTNGAEVVISNVIGGSIDIVTDGTAKLFTNALGQLGNFAAKLNVDSDKTKALASVRKQVAHLTKPDKKSKDSKDKRDDSSSDVKGGLDGIKGSITNIQQVFDTMKNDMGTGHAAQDTINAFITGADSQIDNAIATLSYGLDSKLTGGISGDIGNFLLGPFVQSVTNGAEVLISNVIGGSIDIVTDGTAKLFTSALGELESVAVKMNVDSDKTEALSKAKKQVADLKAPKKHEKSKGKRADSQQTGPVAGLTGSMQNAQQVQDTLNRQLSNHDGHSAAEVITAYITGADSQIDNAIATVSEALAPYTAGMSEAIGNVLLGPFVQSVTNGAEVLLSNLLGGGIDMVTDGVANYAQNLSKMASFSTKFGVDSSKLQSVQQQLSQLAAKKQ